MASRIKGITVEIGGDATGLDKALKGVNSSLNKTQISLSDVNRLLKLDPSNTVLVAQKQELLAQAVKQTGEKLAALEDVQDQVAEAFRRGDIGEEKYQAFQREVEETRGKLNQYRGALSSLQSEQTMLSANTERLKTLFEATGKNVDDYADILGSKLVSAIKSGTATSDQLQTAIEKIGRAATGGKADVRKLIDALDSVDDGQAIRSLIEDLNRAGDAAQDTADDISTIAGAAKGTVLIEAAELIGEVGEKLQDVGESAIEVFSDTENAVVKVNAFFNETGAAAERSANVIRDIYESGVGESMDSVANAVLAVKEQLGDLSDTDLTHLTEQAIVLDELYGRDMNETLRGVNSLMEQYGMTAQEAMDYIVAGTQNGLDKTAELGDNLSEYAGKFSQAGYSAQEYFQLLQNGLEGGAYNLDKVNDAINEVTTRLADGTIGNAIGQYSSKTQDLFRAWQDGSASQKDVIDSIVADIAGCENQQDALNLAAQAFGTMAEDGNLKFIGSLTSVGDTYDDVSGAAQGMFDATTTPMQEMESNIRKIKDALSPVGEKLVELANVILPALEAVISTVSDWFSSFCDTIEKLRDGAGELSEGALSVLREKLEGIRDFFGRVADKCKELWDNLQPVVSVIRDSLNDAIDTAKDKLDEIKGAFSGLGDAVMALEPLWQLVQPLLMGFATAVGGVIALIAGGISGLLSGIAGAISGVITTITGIIQTVSGIVQMIVGIFTGDGELIGQAVQSIADGIVNVFSGLWGTVSGFVQGFVDGVIGFFTGLWDTLVGHSIVPDTIDGIVNCFSGLWSGVSGFLSGFVQNVTNIFNELKSMISSIWNGIKSFISSVVNGIKNTVSNVFNAIKSVVTSVFNGIKSVASSVWNAIKSVIGTVVDGIKSKVSGVFNAVKSTVTSVFNGIKSTASSVWNGIKNAIITPIEAAKNKVKSVVDAIKGLFANMKLSLPHIKLPHFSVSGKLSINPPSVPKLSIKWYREGGIMTSPTIFGMNGTSLMAGGEAGAEAILPLKGFYDHLDKALSGVMDTATMERYLAVIAANSSRGIYLDDGTLVGRLAPQLDAALGTISEYRGRRN